MTTNNFLPENSVLFQESPANQTLIKHPKMSLCPLPSEQEKASKDLSVKKNPVSVFYYLKLFLFSLLVFTTIWSMAQQHLPEKRQTAFFPNVSRNSVSVQYADNTATITVDKLEDIRPGDKIRLLDMDKKEPFDAIVSSVKGNYFTVEGLSREKYGDQVYVYGKEVNDFRTVDYDAVSILNYSATQKLTKQAEEQKTQISSLQKEIVSLKTSIEMMVVLLQEQNLQLASLKADQTKVSTPSTEQELPLGTMSSGFIPNVFKQASSVLYTNNAAVLTIDKLEDIRPGDRIRLYNDKNECCETVVSSVNGDCFTVERLPREKFGENVFVYGKKVEDFSSAGL
jgi:hypothetical protein